MMNKLVYAIVAAVVLYFLDDYMNGCKYESDIRIDKKVVIVTGANTGIGKETVKDLVQRGAKVYMGCRSLERGQKALDDVKEETGAKDDQLVLLQLDLASLASVREFVEEFKKREHHLHILINNAGVMWVPYSKTVDGYETTFATNHLGPFLLTNLLADILLASAPSRVVNVASKAQERGSIMFEDLMGEQDFGRMSSYSQSKLANVLFGRELAKRLEGTGVTSYSLHPGAIVTELGRHAPILNLPVISQVTQLLLRPILKDAYHGARTQVYLAVEPGVESDNGKYFSDCAVKEPIAEATNDEVADKLWKVSVDLVKLDSAEIHPKLR